MRSWDTVIYRIAYSVRSAPVDDLVVAIALDGPATWQRAQVEALRLSRCPDGVELSADGREVRCFVGRLEAPPALTVAFELSARVSGAALQGQKLAVQAAVHGRSAAPDPSRANCPKPLTNGCQASAPIVTVSAAPALEVRKRLVGVTQQALDGEPGRRLSWRLELVLGADGDIRGSSVPVGSPWRLPDWWLARDRVDGDLEIPVRLLGCPANDARGRRSCAQPGGAGRVVEVSIDELVLPERLPVGGGASLPQVVASTQLDLWLPEGELFATGWDVSFKNCFATEPGVPDHPLWQPLDAAGQPNLGGAGEPTANNCSQVVLPVPRPAGPPRHRGGGGGGPGPGDPAPPRPGDPGRPRPRPTPEALAYKRYSPFRLGQKVAEGAALASEVGVRILTTEPQGDVVLCDKWDNASQSLREGGIGGVAAYWQDAGAKPQIMAADGVIIESAQGLWGLARPEGTSVGRGWYLQSRTGCSDAAALAPGWVTVDQVDFANAGQRTIDARDVNMIRVRYLDPVPKDTSVWIEVLLRAERIPASGWYMNYGAATWGSGGRTWTSPDCYRAYGSGDARVCPVPAPGAQGAPGPLGDMLARAQVPLRLDKATDPTLPGESLVVNAGLTVAFSLTVSTRPRPGEAPPHGLTAESHAVGVLVTDTLPLGLIYEEGSAMLSSEDRNANGRLDAGEDTNGNGQIDRDVPFPPRLMPASEAGEMALAWRLGDLPYGIRAPTIRFEARSSRLLPSGYSLINVGAVEEEGLAQPLCEPAASGNGDSPRPRRTYLRDHITGTLQLDKCAWAAVIIANTAVAGVEKVPHAEWVMPGQPIGYRLAFANLTLRPVEWFDAVDLLPRAGDIRQPGSRLTGGVTRIGAQASGGEHPLEIWASASDPAELDTAGRGPRDGLVDPVTAWGDGGAGLGGPVWPCRLADVGSRRCGAISSHAEVTALRFWGPDPDRRRTGRSQDSFLAADSPPRFLDLWLEVPGSQTGDLAHNAWGGRFEGLPLPVFDEAIVMVGPRPTTTPSPTSLPTASATVTMTATSSPQPTATPAPSRTARPSETPGHSRRSFLPVALRQPCRPQPVDVVLVIDASTSMLRPAGDGGSKLDAVLRAARAFIGRFAPESSGGRIAIAAFNHRAWPIEPLTSDRTRLGTALDLLRQDIAEGSRLDLGLRQGAVMLGERLPGRLQALVLLTDGLPNWVPTPPGGGRQEDTVLAEADKIRAKGIIVHTVGYGRPDALELADRISPELLRAIAGSEDHYHQTADAGELATTFQRIAALLGCEGQPSWP